MGSTVTVLLRGWAQSVTGEGTSCPSLSWTLTSVSSSLLPQTKDQKTETFLLLEK